MRLRLAVQNGRAFVREAAQTRGRYFSFLREVRQESDDGSSIALSVGGLPSIRQTPTRVNPGGHRPPTPPTLHPLAQLPGRALRKIRLREDPPHRGAGARGEAGSKSGPSLVGERAFRHES